MRGTLSYTKIPSLPFIVFGTWMKSWYNLWTIELYIRYRCERLGYFKHIHLPRRCLPPNFFYSMPRSARWYSGDGIYGTVYTESVSQWREASIICESSGEGNRSSAAAALRLRLHRHSSRFASSQHICIAFRSLFNNPTYPLLLRFSMPSPLLLCCCHLIFTAEILLFFLSSQARVIHWSRGC